MKVLERLRARLHVLTAPRPAPARPALPAMRDAGALPPLRLLAVPGPNPDAPADLLLRRAGAGDGYLLSYAEVSLLESVAPVLRDGLARRSPHYQPAELPPPAEPLN